MTAYKSKSTLSEMYRANSIKGTVDGKFICYPKPHGVECSVGICPDTGASVLKNNETEFVDSELGNRLIEAGVRGDFIISTEQSVRGTSRWLNYTVINIPYSEYKDKIVISIFASEGMAIKPTDLAVNLVQPMVLPFEDLHPRNTQMSRRDDYDGMVIWGEDLDGRIQQFYYVPNRYINGEVLAVVGDKRAPEVVVVEVEHDYRKYVIQVLTASAGATVRIADKCIGPGDKVSIQYTSFNKGLRLSNFSSPIIVRV